MAPLSHPQSGRSGESAGAAGSAGSAGEEKFLFVMPACLEYRDAARAFLSYICETLTCRHALPEDACHRIISAFVEAFNNSVLHAYDGNPRGSVTVELLVTKERLRIVVSDEGRPFEPESVPQPDLEALPEGGLGLFIIRSFMDEVWYERAGERNILSMEKRISGDDGLAQPRR